VPRAPCGNGAAASHVPPRRRAPSPSLPPQLRAADGVLVPGGFGGRGVEGKIAAAHYARTNKVPYLGICLGMQVGPRRARRTRQRGVTLGAAWARQRRRRQHTRAAAARCGARCPPPGSGASPP
jgi:hypothetical protein